MLPEKNDLKENKQCISTRCGLGMNMRTTSYTDHWNENVKNCWFQYRLLLGVAISFLILFFGGITVFAETTGTVIPASAKIRAEANTSSTVVSSAVSGTTLTIMSEVTGDDGSTWYEVYVDASTKGFIRSDLVSKGTSTTETATTTTTTAAADTAATTATANVTAVDNQTCRVSVTSARVRTSASTTADLVASVGKGTTLTITGKTTGDDGKEWYQVSFTYNNQSYKGFVRADLVTFGEIEEEPAVTEVEGGTQTEEAETAETTETGAEATDSAAETGTETVSADAVAEETTQDETQSASAEMTILTTEETPPLPEGFTEVAVTLNDQAVRAWKNGDFYIFYAQSSSGGEGFYMYDSAEVTYQRFYMSNVVLSEEEAVDGSIFRTLVIVLAIVVVLLLVLVTILAIKMNDYRSELEWDRDDDDDDDNYDDDNYDDDDDDSDDEDEDRYDDNHDDISHRRKESNVHGKSRMHSKTPIRHSETSQETSRKVQTSHKDTKPRNFLEVEEEQLSKITGKTPMKTTSDQLDFDPDDEDTFVFINLDGDEID